MRPRIIIDFDGTIVEHRYPDVGRPVPGAIEVIKGLMAEGCWLGLFTVRSGQPLLDAVAWLEAQGLKFDAINEDPGQREWSQSPKMYGHIYIDDAALGCPLRESVEMGARPMVDWGAVHLQLVRLLQELKA